MSLFENNVRLMEEFKTNGEIDFACSSEDETRFRVAMGIFDISSILVGIVVILGLVAMLVALLQWLNNDILHSALLITSGLQ